MLIKKENLPYPKMGGIIPRYIKIKVIRHWQNGLTREEIAKKNDIGAGTVTGIIQEARKQEEYSDIDLLREVSRKLKEEGLALPSLGFAIRLKRIMEENDIKEDQIDSLIQDFAIYRLRRNISYDTITKIGREALYLEQKYGIPIEKIPEYIVQGKEILDRLEDQRQEILRKKKLAREELDTIVAKLEKYGNDTPLIERIEELENELYKTRRSEKTWEAGCKILRGDMIILDNEYTEQSDCLSQANKESEKVKEVNEKLTAENRILKLVISDLMGS